MQTFIKDEFTISQLQSLGRSLKDINHNTRLFCGALLLKSAYFKETLPIISRVTYSDNGFYGTGPKLSGQPSWASSTKFCKQDRRPLPATPLVNRRCNYTSEISYIEVVPLKLPLF